MDRNRITIVLLIACMAFASCSKTYTCNCQVRPGVHLKSQLYIDCTVKARDKTSAAKKCEALDDDMIDCYL